MGAGPVGSRLRASFDSETLQNCPRKHFGFVIPKHFRFIPTLFRIVIRRSEANEQSALTWVLSCALSTGPRRPDALVRAVERSSATCCDNPRGGSREPKEESRAAAPTIVMRRSEANEESTLTWVLSCALSTGPRRPGRPRPGGR